jgi:hypothetical protein
MRENYINGFSCSVDSGAIDNVSTTLPVTIAAPVDSGFRILIDNELMLVMSGGTTTNWTVTRAIESTLAIAHGATTSIYVLLTAGSVDQIRQDMVGYGGSLPSSPKAGDIFTLSTTGTQYMYTGSTWQPYAYVYVNNVIDIPPASPTAWDDEFLGSSINLTQWGLYDPYATIGTITESMSNSWFTMSQTNSSSTVRIFGYMQMAPSGTWTFRTKFAIDAATGQNFGMGMFARNSSGDHCVSGMQTYFSGQICSYWMERSTSGSSSIQDVDCYNNAASPMYMEMAYDGTNIYFRCSVSGAFYTPFFTEAISNYLGAAPTQVGIMMMPYGDGSGNPKIGLTGSWDWFRRIA